MRPNKPGYWWYLPIRGEAKIAYLAKGYAPYLCVVEEKIIGIHQFESQSNFKQWLVQAHPPKKVRRIKVDVFRELLSGYRHTIDVYYGIKEDDHGDFVKYDDVKEYLLNGDENEE
jgi:hypothetical protein